MLSLHQEKGNVVELIEREKKEEGFKEAPVFKRRKRKEINDEHAKKLDVPSQPSDAPVPDEPAGLAADIWDRRSNHRVPRNKKVFGDITYAEVEEAVWNSRGLITQVARRLRISVYHVKQIFGKYKTLRQDFDEFREMSLDEIEGMLMTKIRRMDTTAIIFALKCLGKGRGYIEATIGSIKKAPVRIRYKKATEKDIKKANVINFKKKAEGE